MMTKIYLNAAREAVRESYRAVERGQYWEAWGMAIPARANYLADGAVNAAALPFYVLGAGCGAVIAAFTWGRETKCLKSNLVSADNSMSRVFFGVIGGIVSPAGAAAVEIDSFAEVVATAALVSAVAAGLLFIAQHIRWPNAVFYNSQTGFTWGWYL